MNSERTARPGGHIPTGPEPQPLPQPSRETRPKRQGPYRRAATKRPAAPTKAALAALSETPALVSWSLPLSMVGLTVGAEDVPEGPSVATELAVPTLLLVMVADSAAKDELPVPVGM